MKSQRHSWQVWGNNRVKCRNCGQEAGVSEARRGIGRCEGAEK